MGSFSKKVFKSINVIPEKARNVKFAIGENIAIIRKRKLYKGVIWTKEEHSKFMSYWSQFGGMKPYWHKLYQSANGVFNVKYFPEKLYTTKLEPLLNPWIYKIIFSDKSLMEMFWGDVEEVYIPKTYLKYINGSYYYNNTCISIQQSCEILNNLGECILKPTNDTGSGRGIRLLDLTDGVDLISNEKATGIITGITEDFIIQEKIANNEKIKKLNPTSLNTIRAITYRIEEKIHCISPILRMGVDNSLIDNIHAGGLCIGINQDGTLKENAYKLGWGDNNQTLPEHPTSKVVFKDYYIGDIQRLLEVAKKLHQKVPHLGIISWDLTINDKNDVVLIEANCSGQSVWFPQVVNAEPLFGEDTEYFIKLITNKD